MIAIIKYNAGNTKSVQNALQRLGQKSVITDDPRIILNADKVIFPGVGEASTAMSYLKEKGLDKLIVSLKKPVLGICLGLQLMCKSTEEGNVKCLGIFDNEVKKFQNDVIVPHMGWNSLTKLSGKLTNGLQYLSDVYFVHSYYADISKNTGATALYGEEFSAVLEKDNFYAAQFHPEKSSKIGNKILENFIKL